MTDLIELLNHTSGPRTVFYCIVFIIALVIVALAVTDILSILVAAFKRKQKP